MITYIFLSIIVVFFIYFIEESGRLYSANKLLFKAYQSDDALRYFENTKFKQLVESYKSTVNIETTKGIKSNIPSNVYINEVTIGKTYKINLRTLDSASSTLVGLGLLGTFAGLSYGISQFESSDTNNIQRGIQNLLEGMGTAFYTSLVGMFFSLLFTAFYKYIQILLQRNIHGITEKIDGIYYIDDLSVLELRQNNLLNVINTRLSYTSDSGERVPISNAIREILSENSEQTKALKAFSTDLALELNNGFDEVLSRQMQQKILPLMENVDITTKAIIEHIDSMASKVTSPASEMVQSIVSDLQSNLQKMVEDYRNSITGSLTDQVNNLSSQLSVTAETMAKIPVDVEGVSQLLQNTVADVKSVMAEISTTGASVNESLMEQMKNLNSLMLENANEATERMNKHFDQSVATISETVQESIKNIIEDINNKQVDMLALQDDISNNTKEVLNEFTTGLETLKTTIADINTTMFTFRQAHGHIEETTGHLENIASDMRHVSDDLSENQSEYIHNMQNVVEKTNENIDSISIVLDSTNSMSKEYVEDFNVIKQGLTSIFNQLQNGLVEYSRTVQASTQQYLDQYSTSLTQTTEALAGTIRQQQEVVEMLNELLENNKK